LVFKDTYANLNLDETTTLEVGTFTAGGALKWSSGIFGYSLAADYTHLAQVSGIDWRRKVHLGLELDTTLLQIWGGISQMQLCYGAGINLWLFKVQAASYGEPIGVSYDQSASRRYIVQALTKIPL
jgi:hypothetical protein